MQEIRVRFAPSPTGDLHLGGARTALFNFFFARHNKGTFILRIEDTDLQRSHQKAVETIINGLKWLGLDWDEGPFFQSQRLEIYQKYARQLLQEGKAREIEGKAIQFICPKEKIIIHDLIRGPIEFDLSLINDFVILKSDGNPTYNFACAIDDSLMKISHVIRGDDHISNTPRQAILCKNLNFALPHFAHVPMIHGADNQRMSKRHGATSILEYEKQGYLPEAMLNYLARLGWGYQDQEVFSKKELVEKFTIERVKKTPAIFDLEKLNWLNSYYIKNSLPERIFDLCLPYLEKEFGSFAKKEESPEEYKKLVKIIRLFQDRIKTLGEITGLSCYFFKEVEEYDAQGVEKYFKGPKAKDILKNLAENLGKLENFSVPEIEKSFKFLAENMQLKLGQIIHPCRLALTGRTVTPGIYDVVEILEKAETLKRLEKAIEFIMHF